MKRQIIAIDEELCNGCGDCETGCPEGALRVVDGKARLVGDLLCDGLGACLGNCPQGAISIVEREAEPYDEARVMKNLLPQGQAVIKAHLEHLEAHGERGYLAEALALLKAEGQPVPAGFGEPAQAVGGQTAGEGHSGCPGLRAFAFSEPRPGSTAEAPQPGRSGLRQWPIQLHLVSPAAPYFRGRDLLLAADCTAFAAGDFHRRYLKDRALAIACPKLDEGLDRYRDKLIQLIEEAGINTLTVLRMHVPCCGGLVQLAIQARDQASRKVPVKVVVIDPEGTLLQEEWL